MNKTITALILALLLMIFPAALAAPKPGEKNPAAIEQEKKNSLQIKMSASMVFANAGAVAKAGIENPIDSGMELSYRLVIDAEELQNVTGEPHSEPLTVFEQQALPQGGVIDTVSLNTELPQGTYKAYMMIDPVYSDGTMVSSNFKVETIVQVMTDAREATLGVDGLLMLAAHNGCGKVARYELVVSAAELLRVSGVELHDANSGFKPEDCYLRLFETGEIEGYQDGKWTAIGLPGGQGLPKGEYTCWLIRHIDGQEPYGCAKVALNAEEQQAVEPDGMEWSSESRMAYAQAVVNTNYLLGMTEIN